MRNDHVFYGNVGYPTQADIELAMRRAHRMRSEAVHAYLRRGANWVRWLFRTDAIKVTVRVRAATPQHC